MCLFFLPFNCCIVLVGLVFFLGFVNFGNVWCSENSCMYGQIVIMLAFYIEYKLYAVCKAPTIADMGKSWPIKYLLSLALACICKRLLSP